LWSTPYDQAMTKVNFYIRYSAALTGSVEIT